ncbi:MAG: hypothetical protein AB7F35_31475 [Acetobacteraceae bacterium]
MGIQREFADRRALGQHREHQVEIPPADVGAAGAFGVVLVIAGEHITQRDVTRVFLLAADVQGDPLRERKFGGINVSSAERCAASLSTRGIEPGAAPLVAVRASGKPVGADAAGLFGALGHAAGTSRAVRYASMCACR